MRDAELGHAVPIELDVDRLHLLAEGLDLRDVLDQKQLAAEEIDRLLELGVGESSLETVKKTP